MNEKKIINILPIDRIKNKNLNLKNLVSIESKNNIEFDIQIIDSLYELQKNYYNQNFVNCGFIIDDDSNYSILENQLITLIKDEDNSKYLIVNEPIDSHNMNKLYIKKSI